MRLGVILGSVELTIVIALVLVTIIRAGGDNSVTPFTLGGEGLSPILASLVFVFLSFAGFEGVADLAEEAHQPRRNVGRAVIFAVLALAAVYTAAAYAGVVGFGGTEPSWLLTATPSTRSSARSPTRSGSSLRSPSSTAGLGAGSPGC